MKILLDECLPKRLKRVLAGHEVSTTPEEGLAGIKDSRLLVLAASTYDLFITADRNLVFQNRIIGLGIAVLVLRSKTNRFEDLAPLFEDFDRLADSFEAGRVYYL